MKRKMNDELIRLSDFDISDDDELNFDNTVKSTSDGTLDKNFREENLGDKEVDGENLGDGNLGDGGGKKRRGGWVRWVVVIVVLGIASGIGYNAYRKYQNELILEDMNNKEYAEAISLYESKKYNEAIKKFIVLGDYRDSKDKVIEVQEAWDSELYDKADSFYEDGKYEQAIAIFKELADREYLDSQDRVDMTLAEQRKEYINILGTKLYKINKYKELTYSIGDIVIDTWRKNRDKPIDIVGIEIGKVYNIRASELRQIDIGFNGLEKQMSEINKLGGADKAYDSVMNIYEIYKDIHSNVINPLGEFADYEKKMREYSSKFDAYIERLYVEEPGIKAAYIAERDAELLTEMNSGNTIRNNKDKK